MRQLVAIAIVFKREKDSTWEDGVYVGRHDNDGERGRIIDLDGLLVEGPIWDYKDRSYRGCAIFREEGE